MSDTSELRVCSACHRHIAASESACPFCGSDAPPVAAAAADVMRPMATHYGAPPRIVMPAYGLSPHAPRGARTPFVLAIVVPATISLVSLLAAAGVLGVVHRKDGAAETSTALLWNAVGFGAVAVLIAIVGVRSRRN
jgi:hypothetical protein